jgi:hypothetical protein
MVYTQDGTAGLAGQNTVIWSAPNDPSFRFDDLALWTESTSTMRFTGGANLQIDGIVFAPNAHLELAGNTSTQALEAQLWAKTTDLVGGATITLIPREDRITSVGRGKQLLIR